MRQRQRVSFHTQFIPQIPPTARAEPKLKLGARNAVQVPRVGGKNPLFEVPPLHVRVHISRDLELRARGGYAAQAL